MARQISFQSATRVLWALLAVAFVVSVVHYVDNFVNYDEYPVPGDDSAIPTPSAATVGIAWFVFTAFGAVAVWLWRRRSVNAAVVALLGYSLSGLVGFGHYAAPDAFEMVWWRQTHVVVDILCGLAIAGFALWALWNSPLPGQQRSVVASPTSPTGDAC